LEYQSVAEMVI
jgi:hypothetical protein